MPSRVPISVWRQQGVLQWIDEEGDQVPTRAIKYFRSKGWKLDGGSVRRWWRDRAKILAADPGSLRVPGGGRRPLSAAMEEDWYDEVVAKRLKKPNVTRDWIGHMTGVIFACQHPTALVLWETSGEREQVEDGFNLDELHDALHDVAQIYE
ncbi:hypothetical protein PI124_g20790 [Phytophthora idaei]|nr:hypothetical protein PI124_g20790 [Phytophthora idaei]